ncbi:hypothetical protein PHMEG_00022265 [Phytophthora megakarya]|uniref:Transposase Tc1-like domain-containing protein n=1 Tax=Phytophthora megakarya TaxID=4795 RepID=A0A225VJV2_9STRA|nr:hypothetical protein PHMEG_00022265 [Phytophthora megakarya]
MNLSPQGITNILNAGSKEPAAKRGRPKALTARETRQVVRAVSTGDNSASELKTTFNVTCTTRTIQRVLKNVDFLAHSKMDRTFPLTKEHKEVRH